MKKALKIIALSALITAAAIKGAPAIAEPAAGNMHVEIVRTGDLDLSAAHGRRQLDIRLAHAAREVCGKPSDSHLAGKNGARRCRGEVLASARAQRDDLLAGLRANRDIRIAAVR
jgi:UrcA family protein